MTRQKAHRGIRGLGISAGALVAATLIPLAAAPTAAADVDDSPVDVVDIVLQDIDNFFNAESAVDTFSIDLSDLFAPEGIPVDPMIDAFYPDISVAFQPEGAIDMFLESLLGLAFF